MDILMIGGTGTISYDATCYFLEKGHNVYLLNRGNRNDLKHENLHYIIGNANDTENMKSSLKGKQFDVVLDFIIYTKAQLEKRVPIYNTLCKQFIFISSATVYAPTSEIINEDSQLGNDNWYYSREKLECENYLRAHKDSFNFAYTIIRPYITYDARRLPFPVITKGKYYSLIDRIQKGKPVVICGDGSNKLTLTHTKDFAVALEGLLLNERAANEEFHITGDCVTDWNEILGVISKTLNVLPNVVYIPVDELAKYYPSESQELLYDKSGDHVFSNHKICSAVPAFKTTLTVEAGISQTVQNLIGTEKLHKVDEEWNAIIDVVIEKFESSRGNIQHKASSQSWRTYHRSQDKVWVLLRKILKKLGIKI